MLLDLALPFVLLEDAREGAAPARLYRQPTRILRADRADAVPDILAELKRAGGEAAGYLAYGAGAVLEPKLAGLTREAGQSPLAWFGLFDRCERIADVPALLPDAAGAWIGAVRPAIDRAGYDAALERVLGWIAAGDIYQANLTFRAAVSVAGHPLALYAAIRGRAAAGLGGVVWTGEEWLLSFSPELFFQIDGRTVMVRPMKGTARRGVDAAEDAALVAALAADPKQRAENLMIVDLMRNDLSRVAVPGSVAAPALFAVETYPTLHQMTSTVTAHLADGNGAVDLLASLFPCGSITGAPKIRAMEVIDAVEAAPRGAYTGAIGWVGADGDACFNVAIRTLTLPQGATEATIGLGSGIVADSTAPEEWDECLAKGSFLSAGQRRFDLIETMAFDPEEGLLLLERHLARMKASAEAFGFAFDRHTTRNELQAATFRLRAASRIRLLLSSKGVIAIESAALPPPPAGPVQVAVLLLPVDPADFRLRHKTGDRRFYDAARIRAGTWEVALLGPDGFLTEGSFTSLFVERDGMLVTPPLSRGLLPGILRAELLDTGRAVEGDLTPADLTHGFFVGNAVRGLVPAVVAVANGTVPGL